MARMQQKIALVTGAGAGIGEGVARAFAAEGATVILTDIREQRGQELASSIGPSAVYKHMDVRHEADWIAVIDAILEERGRLDVLVNNAAITGFEGAFVPHDPEHAELEHWRTVFAVNVDGTFLGCKHAIRAMRAQQTGSIINMSSRSGLVGTPAAAAYAASKAAIRNHTKTVALYCAEQGWAIRCNSIHPAAILTPMWDPMLGQGELREARMQGVIEDTPLRRFGRIEEVAALAVMLASDEVTYMTGAELNLDGGILAGPIARKNKPLRADTPADHRA